MKIEMRCPKGHREINKSNYPQETTLMLTEKGREIGLKLDEVERMMEE